MKSSTLAKATAMSTAALLALAGCATATEPSRGVMLTPLINSTGQVIGSVRLWETPGAVTLRVLGTALPVGMHGLHVHSVGRCDTPDFTSAGPHWNPGERKHGVQNPAGSHAGDLVNVPVAANGALGETVTVAGASFAGLNDADGSALVLHAAADDYRTDPSGNSGARIACAVLSAAVPAK